MIRELIGSFFFKWKIVKEKIEFLQASNLSIKRREKCNGNT